MNDVSFASRGNGVSVVWWVAFVASGLAYIALRGAIPVQWGWLVKIIPIALLLFRSLSEARGKPRAFLAAGLLLSATGDVLLSLEGLFIPGLGAFLLAQLTYAALFLSQFRWRVSRLPWVVLVVGYVLACSVLVLPETGNLQWVITAYMVAISLMALAAGFRNDRQFLWVAMGALVFMVSDTLIAVNTFVSPFPFADAAIMVTYYLAQALIVLGIIRHNREKAGR
ncbi:lysoplasmalogenase [Marinobacter sp. LN3S78]|uniref:lysoplasmalogenase n=1 Tax=Marinobacter sp. LN3S78 TaxID=3382300 RepID=UPI00387B5295